MSVSPGLDAETLAEVKKNEAAFAAGRPYRGHEGLAYAPIFVVTVRVDGQEREVIAEGFEEGFIKHLRRISAYAHETPLRQPRCDKHRPGRSAAWYRNPVPSAQGQGIAPE